MIQRLLLIMTSGLIALQAEISTRWSLEELASEAEVVMHGRVLSTTCLRDNAGRIYTEVEIEPISVLKGKTGASPKIVHSGGVLGEEQVAVVGQVSFIPGEEFIGFLLENERGELVTVGMNAGKLTVTPDQWKIGRIEFDGKSLTLEEVQSRISRTKVE